MKDLKKISKKQLGELMVERGVITHEQINKALEYQKEHKDKKLLLGEILVELNFATEKDIAEALTCQYGFPYLPLLNYDIDTEVLNTIPENMCREFCLVPIDKIGNSLTIAMSNPLNVYAMEQVEKHTGCNIQIFVSTSADIKQSIEKYFIVK